MIPDRDREPSLLLFGPRRSGKTRTRMRLSQQLRMSRVNDAGELSASVTTGERPAPTVEIEEYRAPIGDRAARVLDVPGEIVDASRREAGALRDALEARLGALGGVLLCVAPPLLPPGQTNPQKGFVHPALARAYCELFPPGEGIATPAPPHLADVKSRLDASLAAFEELASRRGAAPSALSFAVQVGFADFVSLGDSDEEDEAERAALRDLYAKLWPEPGSWLDPASIERRAAIFHEIGRRSSALFGELVASLGRSFPRLSPVLFPATSVDDPLGHRSVSVGFSHFIDGSLGRDALTARERARRASRARAFWRGAPLFASGFLLFGLAGAIEVFSGEGPPEALAEVSRRSRGGLLREEPSPLAPLVRAREVGPAGLSPGTRLAVRGASEDGAWIRVEAEIAGERVAGWMHKATVDTLGAGLPALQKP